MLALTLLRTFPALAGAPPQAWQALAILHHCCRASPALCEATVNLSILETLLSVRDGPHGSLALLAIAAAVDGVALGLAQRRSPTQVRRPQERCMYEHQIIWLCPQTLYACKC